MVVVMMVKIRKMKTPTKNKILFSEGGKNSPNKNKAVMNNYQKICNTSRIGVMRTYLKQLLLLEHLHLDFTSRLYFFFFAKNIQTYIGMLLTKNLIIQMIEQLKKNIKQLKRRQTFKYYLLKSP